MSHNDTQPQGAQTREEFLALARECHKRAIECPDTWTSNKFGHINATLAFLIGALSAPPTEPPTPTEDGAALALLVALVSELQALHPDDYKMHVFEMTNPDLHRAFRQAQDYVRTQAAKGEAGK